MKKFSKFDLNVSRETLDRLAAFENLFGKWSNSINLVASSTMGDVWERHIADSAQLLSIKPDMNHVIDIGSGGGFPGIVLAILLNDVEGSRVDLVESNRKKTAFLQAAKAQCASKAHIHAKRIEDALPHIPTAQYVSARALASLPNLLNLAAPQLEQGAIGLFHKGRDYLDELKESRDDWVFDLITHTSMVDNDSVILEISNLKRKPA